MLLCTRFSGRFLLLLLCLCLSLPGLSASHHLLYFFALIFGTSSSWMKCFRISVNCRYWKAQETISLCRPPYHRVGIVRCCHRIVLHSRKRNHGESGTTGGERERGQKLLQVSDNYFTCKNKIRSNGESIPGRDVCLSVYLVFRSLLRVNLILLSIVLLCHFTPPLPPPADPLHLPGASIKFAVRDECYFHCYYFLFCVQKVTGKHCPGYLDDMWQKQSCRVHHRLGK